MWTLFGFIIVIGSSFAFGWSKGSQDGFAKAVEQLDKIVASVNRMNKNQ